MAYFCICSLAKCNMHAANISIAESGEKAWKGIPTLKNSRFKDNFEPVSLWLFAFISYSSQLKISSLFSKMSYFVFQPWRCSRAHRQRMETRIPRSLPQNPLWVRIQYISQHALINRRYKVYASVLGDTRFIHAIRDVYSFSQLKYP
jgi:hypothetical protein